VTDREWQDTLHADIASACSFVAVETVDGLDVILQQSPNLPPM